MQTRTDMQRSGNRIEKEWIYENNIKIFVTPFIK